MPKTLIESFPEFTREVDTKQPYLNVAEFFMDTIQGENFVGWPAAFLRLQNCTQSCIWCDTSEVWRRGNPYTLQELMAIMAENGLFDKLCNGQHLVLTGGSPVLQQEHLTTLLQMIRKKCSEIIGGNPVFEIENECTIMPDVALMSQINIWNNSPKLASSKNHKSLRYRPEILRRLSGLKNSWFKFVIGSDEDWKEIEEDFLPYIRKNQIVLMPLGATREELEQTRMMAVELAVKHGVRFSTREHIVLWNKKTGV
jgi:7-carboxy-7-deazaguanine synthase